jgi:hypothetical protein
MVPGHQAAHVEHEQAAVEQRLRHVAVDDALGQPFDDGRLAHAWLAHQRGIVLGAPAENLDHALDLLLATDDRVEFAFLGRGGHVVAKLVHERRLGFFFLLLFGLRLVLEDVARGLRAHAIQVDAEAAQHVDRDAFPLAHQAQQQVLGANVMMPHQAGFVDGQFDHTLRARGQRRLAKGGAFAATDGAFHRADDLHRLHA